MNYTYQKKKKNPFRCDFYWLTVLLEFEKKDRLPVPLFSLFMFYICSRDSNQAEANKRDTEILPAKTTTPLEEILASSGSVLFRYLGDK